MGSALIKLQSVIWSFSLLSSEPEQNSLYARIEGASWVT